ncbi:MAG: glutamine amidotransferase [Pseudomonadota bacterium]
MKRAAVIQHLAFEDLGTLAPALTQAGFQIDYLQAGVDSFDGHLSTAELLIVLGGPIGVYETDAYPWLADETGLIRQRIHAGGATLGICLGAQLIAAALGGEVRPGTNGKEIGWSSLEPVTQPAASQKLGALLAPELRVLHWHGDTFSLPAGATHLARSAQYENQAFSFSDHVLALQFHPEVRVAQLERWYIGHSCELGAARVSIPQLRADGAKYGPSLESAAAGFWRDYLAGLR